jgi:hypothetical protein
VPNFNSEGWSPLFKKNTCRADANKRCSKKSTKSNKNSIQEETMQAETKGKYQKEHVRHIKRIYKEFM